MAAGRFSVEAVFKAIDKVTAPVSRMQNRIGKLTRSMARGLRRVNVIVNKMGRGLKRGAGAVAAAAVIATAAMAPLVATGAEFEQAIVNVGAVGMKTRAQIRPLEKQALELGRSTKFTATQAAQAMEVLARAGFNAQQILSATPAVLSAAAASGLEIAEVADHVSNALKGMGLDVSEAAKVADVLALASSRTNSTIGTLGESLSNVASTARQLKIPFNDVVASVALLQDVGLDASVAGSAFNTMLTKMAAPTKAMQKKMRGLGISFKDAKGDMLALPDVIDQLSKASKKVGGNFDQVAFLAELVGLRGQKAAANLAELFETGKLKKLTKELNNAEGAAGKMAALRMDTVSGSFLLLTSAIDAVKVRIFNLNSGPLKALIDNTIKWVGANEELIATNVTEFITKIINNFSDIVKWAERIGKALTVFVIFAVVVKSLIAVMTLLNLVMTANPIGLIIVGVGALIAGLVLLISNFDKVKAGIMAVGEVIKKLVMSSPFGLLIKAMGFGFKGIKAIGSALGAALGIGGGPESQQQEDPQIVSPEERMVRRIETSSSISKTELSIRDHTGRAELQGSPGMGTQFTLARSGGFN
jgi:TP901 family phage tail tape measure protein